MKRKAAVWIAAGCAALIILAALYLPPRTGEYAKAPQEDFRTRLSSTGSMTIGRENKKVTIAGEDKQALVTLLNSLTIEAILGGPEPTHAPGWLFWLESTAEDGTEEARFEISGLLNIRAYSGDKIIDYRLPEQDYRTLCGALDELFQSKYRPDAK